MARWRRSKTARDGLRFAPGVTPMKLLKHCIAAVCIAALAQTSPAQDTAAAKSEPEPLEILKGRPDAAGEQLLGGTFRNALAGIALQVPKSCNPVPKTAPDEIVRFASDDKTWEMAVSKTSSAQPMSLTEAAPKMGLLEVTAARLKQTNPGIEIVR